MKPLLSGILPLLLTLFAPHTLPAQQGDGPYAFHYDEIVGQLGCLNKRAIEHIAISGNGSEKSDQNMLDTLKMFLQDRIGSPGSDTCKAKAWRNFKRKIKNITIRNAGWKSLPEELGSFDNLYELVFVNCPNLNLQTIDDQLKAANPKSNLYTKFHEEIVSLTFSDTDYGNVTRCDLSKGLLGDLRELRFVRIANFHQHCDTILNQLYKAYPKLSWLTLEHCQLTDDVNLAPLDSFDNMIALSLAHNYLTEIPYFHKNLKSLDLSYNLIGDFRFRQNPDSNYLKELDFIFLECNLFNYYKLTSVSIQRLFERLEVFTYDCNCDDEDEYRRLSSMFDRMKVATFMTYTYRYANDFNPEYPECGTCDRYRNDFVSNLLKNVVLRDPEQGLRKVMFNSQNGQHISMGRVAEGGGGSSPFDIETFSFMKVVNCKKNTKKTPEAPWDWEIRLRIKEIDRDETAKELKEFDLTARIDEIRKTGTVDMEQLPESPDR